MTNIKIKKLENSEVEIEGEINTDDFESNRKDAIKKLSQNIDVAGFRKGNVPENIIVQKIGEMPILEEMAERAIAKAYPEMLMDNKIDAIGRPEVSITKIAKGSPLGFKLKTAVMPEIELADYKKISTDFPKSDKVIVEEKEISDVIENILKTRQEQKENNDEKSDKKDDKTDDKKESPEITDEIVKTLGDFKNVEDFKNKLRENIQKEKETKAIQKRRMDMMDKIILSSKMTLPNVIIESELDKMMSQFEGDIAKMGLKFEEYLKHIKKTREDLRKEWRTDAEKRSKVQIILNKIATLENIKAKDEDVDREVKIILEHYKDADKDRAKIYVETILTNEKVFEFLDKR
jgi:FKBP-type peptidyl-prolyl cis-trans isomerase (trigger factor)